MPTNVDSLSDYEKRIVGLLKEVGTPMEVEDISAKTGIDIDSVVTACMWLLSDGWLKSDRQPDPTDLELRLAEPA